MSTEETTMVGHHCTLHAGNGIYKYGIVNVIILCRFLFFFSAIFYREM